MTSREDLAPYFNSQKAFLCRRRFSLPLYTSHNNSVLRSQLTAGSRSHSSARPPSCSGSRPFPRSRLNQHASTASSLEHLFQGPGGGVYRFMNPDIYTKDNPLQPHHV